MKKSLLAAALFLALCLGLLPGAALAEEEEGISSPPNVADVQICKDSAGAWVEVTIRTPGEIYDVIQMLSLFGREDFVSCVQAELSVDDGAWQRYDFTADSEENKWFGAWRSGYVSGLRQDSTIRLRLRYWGKSKQGETVVSPWSDIATIASKPEEPFDFQAHDWAKAELSEADGLSLIPADLRTADLTQPITRAEFAAVSVKVYEALSGLVAEPAAENPFTDTSDPEVLKALNVGITNGLSETEFAPDKLLNREQAATMLSRVYKKVAFEGWTLGTDGDFGEAFRALFTMPEAFTDDADISSWARDSVYFMASNGILKGMEGGTFQPRAVTEEQQAAGYAQATREQAVLIAVRLVKNLGT